MQQEKLHLSDSDNSRYYSCPEKVPGAITFFGNCVATSFVTDNAAGTDAGYNSAERNEYFKSLIENFEVDIAALVEFSPSQAKFIIENYPNYKLYGFFSETKNSIETTLDLIEKNSDHIKTVGECVAILVSTKFSVEKIECIVLPPGTRHARIATVAEINIGKKIITVISTHLDHLSRESRQKSLKILQQKILDSKNPVLMYGDLNLFPDAGGEEDYQKFVTGKIVDVNTINHFGPNGTFVGFNTQPEKFLPKIDIGDFGNPIIPQSNRIDVIFATDLKIHNSYTCISVFHKKKLTHRLDHPKFKKAFMKRQFPSDHLPVLTQVEYID